MILICVRSLLGAESNGGMEEPSGDVSRKILVRTKDLIDTARERQITLRVLGGIAVLIHGHAPFHPRLAREVRDADLVVEKGRVKQLVRMFHDLGFEENRRFNLLNGKERLIYFDPQNGTQLDVFVGVFSMCHRLPLNERLGVERYTLALAEILLTKLQIVHLNDKDIKDVLAVLLQHETQESEDGERINLAAMAAPCGTDWGFYRTVTDNLALVKERLAGAGLAHGDAGLVSERITAIVERIERQPKSAAWRLRALVGTRVRWYELPEEVAGAIDIGS
jgi:hypothetical protein